MKAGDRVVVPFNISCNTCWMCSQGLQSQCETTQNRDQGYGASLFGYTKLYGQVPGGQAEYLRVPFGNTLPIKVPDAPRTTGSSTCPTSCRRPGRRCSTPASRQGGSVLVLGLGPIGDMAARIALHLGAGQVVGADVVPERLARARAWSDGDRLDRAGRRRRPFGTSPTGAVRTPSSTPSAWRRTARRSPLAQKATAVVPDAVMEKVMQVVGVDRLAALNTAIEAVRRAAPSPCRASTAAPPTDALMRMFDKQIQLRMGQANVWRWVPDILPLLIDGDPLGVDDFATVGSRSRRRRRT